MRLSRRITSRTRAIVVASVFVACSLPRSAFAQSPQHLSVAWTNAVHALANRIAAAAGNTQSVSLDVKNISSLSPSDASVIEQSLEAELTGLHFRLVPAPATAASDTLVQVHVTFSEGVDGFVWVAEIRPANASEQERQVAIVEVSRQPAGSVSEIKDSMTLDKKLVWEQPGKFLDFAMLPQSTGSISTLVVLEPARLALYRSSGAQWQLSQTVTIARSNAQPRDVTGHIDVAAGKVFLTGLECAVDFQQPQTLNCGPANRQPGESQIKISGHDQSEMAELGAKCGDESVELVTGTGDWTQPDSIQGFELPNSQAQPIAASDPIGINGPILSLWNPPGETDARAVAYDLKTGDYEGYIVNATCTH